jgi:uncharacterized protein
MDIKNWVKNHSILTFITLLLPVSWILWTFLIPLIGTKGLFNNPPIFAFVFVIAGQAWASLCGLLTTRLVFGREGMQSIKARLRNWKVGRWWLALLIIPAATAVTPLLRYLAGFEVNLNAMMALLIPGLLLGIFSGFAEEFGWRGFLLPELLKSFSPFAATVILGLIWGGLWHGYADYIGIGSSNKGVAIWPIVFLLGPCLLTAWSLIITRIYQRTQASLLVSIFMHAGISSSALIFGQTYSSISEEITWTVISVIVAFLAALLVWKAIPAHELA